MITYVLASSKKWHDDLFEQLASRENEEWIRISTKEELSEENLSAINPTKVFIPHWSYIIPSNVYEKFECIVFHMTDLPYGRGGSPLQNLIVRGHKDTKMSAIRVAEGIDTGPVYLKRPLSLAGTALEIFERGGEVIEKMIVDLIEKNIEPEEQKGEIVEFKRRKPHESDILGLEEINQVYDFIRMLDCDGYPKAFLSLKNFRIEFENAILESDSSLTANVRIIKK